MSQPRLHSLQLVHTSTRLERIAVSRNIKTKLIDAARCAANAKIDSLRSLNATSNYSHEHWTYKPLPEKPPHRLVSTQNITFFTKALASTTYCVLRTLRFA